MDSTVTLPLSKSESNRALTILALTPGADITATPLSDCDDTRAMVSALTAPPASGHAVVNVGPAGTAMRFLTALMAARPGTEVTLDGDTRMRQRPIGPLVAALRRCGAAIDYAGREGYPPLHITGRKLHGGPVSIDSTVSSQFLSALMMVAPAMTCGIDITLLGTPVSRPYLHMTAAMMQRAGADVTVTPQRITVAPGAYRPDSRLTPEGDWSAASYWFEIAALTGSTITLGSLTADSLQGDSRVARIMTAAGVRTVRTGPHTLTLMADATALTAATLTEDLADAPDLVPALAVTCCLRAIPFRFTGLRSLRIKESDRLEALRTELAKLGYELHITTDHSLEWHGLRHTPHTVEPIDCHADHRMAMAFAPAATLHPGLRLRGAQCVTKSYPRFWHDLRAAGFTIDQTS